MAVTTIALLRDYDGNVVRVLPDLSDWSAQEDSTPIDASDTSGSVGGFSIAFAHRLAPHVIKGFVGRRRIRIDDDDYGLTLGNVAAPSSQDGVSQVTVDNKLARLAVTRTAKPYAGTLGGAIDYYFGLVGIRAEGSFEVDASLASIEVALIGWRDQVWLKVKQLCAAYGMEVALENDDVIRVRPLRQHVLSLDDDAASIQWALDDSQRAQAVEVFYYETRYIAPGDTVLDYRATNVAEGDV